MRRREFVGLIGMVAAWPAPVAAQQPNLQLPTIGFIGPSTPDADRTRRAALLERLGELGWVDGRNLKFEFLWADGVLARAGEIAAKYAQAGEGVPEALKALVEVIGEAPVSLKAKGSAQQAEPWAPANPQG